MIDPITIKIVSGLIGVTGIIVLALWAYRSARRDGVLAAKKEEEKARAEIRKKLIERMSTGKPYGTDSIGVRNPEKWPDKL